MSFTKHLCPGAKPMKVNLVFLLQLLPSLSAFVLEGSKTSYAQFPAWPGVSSSDVNRRLSFEFRTAKPSGLLLYSDTVTCEYLEIRLVRGELRARLDTGVVLAVTSGDGLTSHQGWADAKWHTVELVRTATNISISVDSVRRDSVMCDTLSRGHDVTKSSSGTSECWPVHSVTVICTLKHRNRELAASTALLRFSINAVLI